MAKKPHYLPGFALHRLLLQTTGLIKSEDVIAQTLTIPKLTGPAEIKWNELEVPTIEAATALDAVRIQGYIHARMRGFQMDFLRRMPSGELAELLGSGALPYDTFMRKLNLREHAHSAIEAWNTETRAMVQSYLDGVNHALSHAPLSPEYRLLKLKPRPWDEVDCSLITYFLSWTLNSIWTRKWAYQRLKDDTDLLAWLFSDIPGTPDITIIPHTGSPSSWGSTGIGSNNWVVNGSHTQNGHPLLANDPHLAPQLPSIWFQLRLTGGPLDVTGVSLPGCPGIVIGQNQFIAWGVTNVDPDCQDLFQIHMQDDTHYLLDGDLQELQSRTEEIRVRGENPRTIQLELSHAGPVIYREPDGTRIAFGWTGLAPITTLNAALSLNLATNWKEFVDALKDWTVPAQNFVYADHEGNIGYVLAGRIPTREKGPHWGVADGNRTESLFTGTIPYNDLPRLFNPSEGYIITANNAVQGSKGKPQIHAHNSLGYRAQRIHTLLRENAPHDPASYAQIQQDVYSEPLDLLAKRLLEVPSMPQNWRSILTSFDGHARTDSVAPTLLYLWAMAAVPAKIHASLSQPFFSDIPPGLPGTHPFPENFWAGMGERLVPQLLQRFTTLDHRTAFQKAHQTGIAFFGPVMEEWTWGRAHLMEAFHPFLQVKATRPVFGRPAMAISGDFFTPNQAAFAIDPDLPWPRSVAYLPSYRQIVDPQAMAMSQFIHLTGQSGHPLSTHYDDMLSLYQLGQTLRLGDAMRTTHVSPG